MRIFLVQKLESEEEFIGVLKSNVPLQILFHVGFEVNVGDAPRSSFFLNFFACFIQNFLIFKQIKFYSPKKNMTGIYLINRVAL